MRVVALIVANNRPEYLTRTLLSMGRYLPPIPVLIQNDGNHDGMAANIQTGWGHALETEWDYLWHQEDDMELIAKIPLRSFQRILDKDATLANMVAKRHPWSTEEHEAGDVITATVAHATESSVEPDYTTHNHIFSLNPCLIPRRVIEQGWDAGNEAGMTTKLLAQGYRFGFYGHAGDTPLVNHIGQNRGPEWKL